MLERWRVHWSSFPWQWSGQGGMVWLTLPTEFLITPLICSWITSWLDKISRVKEDFSQITNTFVATLLAPWTQRNEVIFEDLKPNVITILNLNKKCMFLCREMQISMVSQGPDSPVWWAKDQFGGLSRLAGYNLMEGWKSSYNRWRGTHRIEKLQQDFLWGGLANEHKFHLIKWQHLCSPIQNGGLGIRRVAVLSQALLGKWLWRYATEPMSLWRRVIDSKYGSQWGGWDSNRTQDSHGVSLWKHIRAGWNSFSQYITFKVGDGSHIKFWHDSWCGDQPLRDKFPILFRLSRSQEATVADLLHFHGTTHTWDIEFLRPVQDWKLDIVNTFMEWLYSYPVHLGSVDSICWNLGSREVFEVQSFYSALSQPSPSYFLWRSVWKAKVPSRVAFFLWTAT